MYVNFTCRIIKTGKGGRGTQEKLQRLFHRVTERTKNNSIIFDKVVEGIALFTLLEIYLFITCATSFSRSCRVSRVCRTFLVSLLYWGTRKINDSLVFRNDSVASDRSLTRTFERKRSAKSWHLKSNGAAVAVYTLQTDSNWQLTNVHVAVAAWYKASGPIYRRTKHSDRSGRSRWQGKSRAFPCRERLHHLRSTGKWKKKKKCCVFTWWCECVISKIDVRWNIIFDVSFLILIFNRWETYNINKIYLFHVLKTVTISEINLYKRRIVRKILVIMFISI